ncbi:hypothetical protein M426DRAFT_119092 [Hypoxylon sp. CI-4A]|nr:hypothetical protein M426DRAFT_119092 [Hypoxylon sp. CI-4A]
MFNTCPFLRLVLSSHSEKTRTITPAEAISCSRVSSYSRPSFLITGIVCITVIFSNFRILYTRRFFCFAPFLVNGLCYAPTHSWPLPGCPGVLKV